MESKAQMSMIGDAKGELTEIEGVQCQPLHHDPLRLYFLGWAHERGAQPPSIPMLNRSLWKMNVSEWNETFVCTLR